MAESRETASLAFWFGNCFKRPRGVVARTELLEGNWGKQVLAAVVYGSRSRKD